MTTVLGGGLPSTMAFCLNNLPEQATGNDRRRSGTTGTQQITPGDFHDTVPCTASAAADPTM